ncbi:MAG TPA: hypothetical protein VFE62_16100 [Gemmataceae bacterium]|nr:hypothetical protein [Gemmataceae bacterium]
MNLIEPKEISITDGEGKERKFHVSKMPAWDGLEIMARYPTSLLTATAVPKLAEWEMIKDLQFRIMKYVAVEINGQLQPLATQALIDNHTGDWECLARLIAEEVKYNNRFFRDGTISNFFAEAFRIALAKITETLTQSSAPSSPTRKPVSMN